MTIPEATEAKMTISNNLELVLEAESLELEASFYAVSGSFTVRTRRAFTNCFRFRGNNGIDVVFLLLLLGFGGFRFFFLNLSRKSRDDRF